MEFSVLGPLEVRDASGGVVEVGGPRQRSVLARLLVASGTVVPAERIVDDLWRGEPPPRAHGALQAYVSHLRRVVEPERAPRTPARLLVSIAPGYALRPAPGAVDADVFAAELEAAAAADPAAALGLLETALGRWRGPAYAEVADEPWARPEAVRLDELRVHARERRVAALLELGRSAAAVADLEALLLEHRLREESWRLLVLALYRAGRQGDALAALQRARTVLVEELGLDPGPGLRDLEAAVLAQDPALLAAAPVGARAAGGGATVADRGPGPTADDSAAAAAGPVAPPVPQVVGREVELERLGARAEDVRSSGRPGAALVAGEPGIGKTALAAGVAERLAARGWRTVWGRCPETDGSPALWPWVEVLDALADRPPEPEEAAALAPLRGGDRARAEDEPSARFRQHRALASYLRRVAARQPLVVVLDDLHRADDGTLVALRDLLADPAPGRLLVVGTYRPTEAGDELGETLAALARRDALRLDLGGLGADEVEALVRAVCAEEGVAETSPLLGPGVTDRIAERSGGNPFYVRESARLLAREGALVAVEEVPAGVRDVVRRRLARLPETARLVLRTAAVAGREVDLEVLAAADERGEDEVYDAIEVGVLAGLLEEPGPGRVRFAHALVRDTVYDDLARLRRDRIHARVARALEELDPDDLAGLAHHWTEAGAAGDPARAARHASAAADQAEQRLAYRAGLAQRERALAAFRLLRRPDPVLEVELLAGLARAQQLAGLSRTARETRGEAVRRAVPMDDPQLAARAITAIDVPLIWSNRPYGVVDEELIACCRETVRRLPPDDSELRVRVLAALGTEIAWWSDPQEVDAVQREAVEVAERLGEPAVLAVALNAAHYSSVRQRGPGGATPEIAQRLERLGSDHAMPGVEVLGLLGQLACHCAVGEVDAAAALVARAERLLRRYEMPLFSVIVQLFHGFREVVQGDPAVALETFAASTRPRAGMEMHDLEAIGVTTRICVLTQLGRISEAAPLVEALAASYPPQGAPALALLRAAQGRPAEGEALLRSAEPLPADYLWLLLEGFRADALVACGVRDLAANSYQALLPYERYLHGGETHAMVLGPVAARLARLAELLDRPDAAQAHWRAAAEVAARARAPRWSAEAEEARHRLAG
jgi:DNA-binding SARP family transcriptional activator